MGWFQRVAVPMLVATALLASCGETAPRSDATGSDAGGEVSPESGAGGSDAIADGDSRDADAGDQGVGPNPQCPCNDRTLECVCEEVLCPESVADGISRYCPWLQVERGCGMTALHSSALGAHPQLYVYDDATGKLVGLSSYASICGDTFEDFGEASWGSMPCSQIETCDPCETDGGDSGLPPCTF